VPALFAGVVWDSLLDGSMRHIIERQALQPFLERQRWFGGKARPLASVTFVDWTTLRGGAHPAFLGIVEAAYRDGGCERYILPLAMSSGEEAVRVEREHPGAVLARITGARKGLLYDGIFDDGTCTALLGVIQEQRGLATRDGRLDARNLRLTPDRAPAGSLTPIGRTAPDQSNTSVIFGTRLIMKLFRRVEPGINPDVEIGEYLTTRGFTRVPPLVGTIDYRASHVAVPAASVLMLQEFVWNQGNGWQYTIDELARYFERATALPPVTTSRDEARAWTRSGTDTPPAPIAEAIGSYIATADVLGRRTGELHLHLAGAPTDASAFAPAPYSREELRHTVDALREGAGHHLALLEKSLDRLDDRRRQLARDVLAHREDWLQLDLQRLSGAGARIRCHGDYHLGQVLITEGDVVIIDFEGEPARAMAERRAPASPLRDVAGMMRSFSYAALTGLGAATQARPEDLERLAPWSDLWEIWVGAAFLRAYLAATRGAAFLPAREEDFDALLQVFLIDKALYELAYELNSRPDWVHIPLAGLLRLRTAQHV
jgi:maltose alpha-D-glucosyltransferase/alpha-amylase